MDLESVAAEEGECIAQCHVAHVGDCIGVRCSEVGCGILEGEQCMVCGGCGGWEEFREEDC